MHEVTTDVISLSFTDGMGNLQMLKFTDTPSKVNLSVADIIGEVIFYYIQALRNQLRFTSLFQFKITS